MKFEIVLLLALFAAIEARSVEVRKDDMITVEFNASAVDAGIVWTNRSDIDSLWAFLFFAGVKPVTISPFDPKVQVVSHFAVDQYNSKHSSPFADKLVSVIAAKVVKEFYYITFQLGVTTCRKPTPNPDSCALDPQQPIKVCNDVIVWVRDYKEHQMQVTAFANCQP